MSHNIFDEQKIFAYRKLISLLEKQEISFYDNHYTDLVLFSELGIYEKNPIFIIFGLNEFWQDDAEDNYISISLQAEYDKIKDGIEYLTSVYKQGSENIRDGFPLPITDENLNIIGDFPELVELQETNVEELIQRFLNLLLEIYKLGLEKAIYNANLSIVIAKGDKFSNILKKGSFATNLNILYKHFDRSNFGNEGHFLLTFKKQLEITRELISSKFETHEINDIVITPQVAFSQRKKHVDGAEHVFDAKIRLLDCLFYLEYKGEIKITELVPSRVVLDASNLVNTELNTESILTCGKLQINERECKLAWDNTWYEGIPIGKKSVIMLILLMKTPEQLVEYENIVKEAKIKGSYSSAGELAQQYKSQLVKDLTSVDVPVEVAISVRNMIKPVRPKYYRITSR